MNVILEATAGPAAGRRIVLRSRQKARVGRTPLADYVFDDEHLSGVHFCITFDGRQCHVQDLGSTNGTFVNGKRVMEATLNAGDEVTAGRCRFCVRIDGRAPANERPAAPRVETPPEPPVAEAREAAAVTAPTSPTPPRQPVVLRETVPFPAELPSEAPQAYHRGMQDDAPEVRAAVLYAAVRTRQPWLLSYLERVVARPSPADHEALRWFAILAEPRHVNAIVRIARDENLGPDRFQIAGLFGHPALVNDLLAALTWDDSSVVTAAAAAFEKLTGMELDLAESGAAPPGEPQSVEPATPPPVDTARAFWQQEAQRFAAGTRWSRGWNVTPPVDNDLLQQFDLESRWEVLIRDHFHRRRDVRPGESELEALMV